MPDRLAELRDEVARANRIFANEGIIDAFGHASVRHPENPGRYFLSRSRAPELVQAEDILEYDLDSQPIEPPSVQLYSERVIHGEIYKARPDVNAVVHHHSPALLPFCITGLPLQPVFHLGGTIGEQVPFWDQRDEFGDTNLLVVKPEEGASLARALGPHVMVLMRRHGATVVGASLRELVFRTIYSCRNGEHQLRAMAIGTVSPLSPGETKLGGRITQQRNAISRAYEYWSVRLDKAEGNWPRRTAAASSMAAPDRKPAGAAVKSARARKSAADARAKKASKAKNTARGRKR